MDAGVVQNLLAFGDTEETGALLKGFRAELGNLFQLCAAGEGAVFLPIGDDILRRGGGQTGNLLQKAPGSGVGVHAHGVDAVLHHSAKGGVQLLLGAVVLVLSHADGLGVDLHQLGKGVLQPPGDGHGGAEIDVVVGEFLRRKGRGGVDGSASLADDHVAGLREGFQQLYGHGLGFPGSGAVADGDVPDAVFAHKNGQGGNGLLLLPLIECGVDHGGGQHLAGGVHHGDLAAVTVSGVKPHGDEAFDRGLHQQRLQVQGKIVDSPCICPVGQVAAHLPLDGGEDQTLVGVLGGGADEGRDLHGGLQSGAAHQRGALVARENDVGLENALFFAPVHGEDLMIQHPGDGLGEIVIELVNAVGLRVLGGGAGQHSPAHHQLPQRFADVGVVGKIFGNDVIGTL